MQNRYVGDVGDFGKYALLRNIARTGLRIGVNWYLTPDENYNSDGKHTAYLYNHKFKGYDDDLLYILKDIVNSNCRNVSRIQNSYILPSNTVFYDAILDLSKDESSINKHKLRQTWHNNALDILKESNIVFLDPDNGLEVKSVSLIGRKGNKYISLEELKEYYNLGKSIIFYNHRERKQEKDYLLKFKCLKNETDFKNAEVLGMKFNKGTFRDYVFVIQPQHFYLVDNLYKEFLNFKWQDHFALLCLRF